MTGNAPEQPPQAEVKRLNITGNTSSGVEACVCKLNSIPGNLTEREKGSFCFLIICVSYNARYAKLREVKNAHLPDFWRFSPGWLIFGLGSTVLRILHFLSYFIVFFVSLFLRYALLHRFVSNSFKHLCTCFITFHTAFYYLQITVVVVVVHLLLCRHYFARFHQIVSMDAPVCMDADCL